MKPRTPLKRSAFKPKVTWKKIQPISKNPRRKAKLFIPKAVREAVMERSEGQCEFKMPLDARCPYPVTELHHLKPRGRGGKHTVQNLAGFCKCHHDWVHRHPMVAEHYGLLIK